MFRHKLQLFTCQPFHTLVISQTLSLSFLTVDKRPILSQRHCLVSPLFGRGHYSCWMTMNPHYLLSIRGSLWGLLHPQQSSVDSPQSLEGSESTAPRRRIETHYTFHKMAALQSERLVINELIKTASREAATGGFYPQHKRTQERLPSLKCPVEQHKSDARKWMDNYRPIRLH